MCSTVSFGAVEGNCWNPSNMDTYDPFRRGEFPVGVTTFEASDALRNRVFPCEIWYPATAAHAGQDTGFGTQDEFTAPPSGEPHRQPAVRDASAEPGVYPLIVFSHHSGGHRRSATFLTTHLASHGYVVAALDHSEVVAPELAPGAGETAAENTERVEGWIASRVPDICFLLDQLLNRRAWISEAGIDATQIGIVGHSFGGWTALAVPETDSRIRAIVALAPAGSSTPRPGILEVKLTFAWTRTAPTLYLVAENDVSLPLAGMYELFDRTTAPKQMAILRRADHAHFMDDVEEVHESFRTMPADGDLADLQKEMRPITELCPGEEAHLFTRGMTLCHMDAVLKQHEGAGQFLQDDLETEFAARGVDVLVHKP